MGHSRIPRVLRSIEEHCFKHLIGSMTFISLNSLTGILIPGHALHKKRLQKQKGFGSLFSSQEEKAFLVLVINRG